MHQTAVEPFFLRVYNADSGLWGTSELDQRVSPRLLEAMNHILQQDGIIAYIGQRSEFGIQESELEKRRARDGRRCWISLPASAVLIILGLRLNTSIPEKPVMVFHGSPLVTTLSLVLATRGCQLLHTLISMMEQLGFGLVFKHEDWPILGLNHDVSATHDELGEAISYLG